MKMNSANLTTLFLLLAVCKTAGADQLTIPVEVPTPRHYLDERGFTHVEIRGFLNRGRPGSPALPSRIMPVLLPPGHEVVKVEVRPGDQLPLPGIHTIYPLQKRYPPSHTGPREFTEPDPQIYLARGAFPSSIGKAQAPQYKRGFMILPVAVRPVIYSPASGRVSWIPVVDILVTTRQREKEDTVKTATAVPRARFRGFERDYRALRRLVANPDRLSSYPLRLRLPRGVDHRYLIITSGELAACEGEFNLQALAADKQARGITTAIEIMENIRAAYEGVDDAEKVRNFIRHMYENEGTDYVLLAGDADLEEVGGESGPVVVPVRGLWGNIEYGSDELNIPSDLYYACLDGTFNADLDSVWGEETDDVDLLAEVLVGRAPADSCAEVSNFVRKTLAYQNNLDDHLKSVWLAGEWLAPDQYASQYLEPLRDGSWLGNGFLSGFNENTFFEVDTLYDAGVCEKDCWGPEEILEVMNGDIHILHHCGHSYTNYNMRVTCDEIDAGLVNDRYFFQYTGGCYPGSFDNRLDPLGGDNEVSEQDSFVEHLLLGEHGAFASIMFTRYGVGETLPKYFWHAAFGRGLKNLAAMHAYSREVASGWIEDRYIRWQVYSLNLFGDPEVSLHMSDSPQPLLGMQRTPAWFLGIEGGECPEAQSLVVRNDGQGELTWSAASNEEWLVVTPSSGAAGDELTLAIDSSGLEAGEYQGRLTISSEQASNSPQQLDVYLLMDKIHSLDVTHTLVSPRVDGEISEGEYEGAGFLDIGFVAAGLSTARVTHDDEKLYVALIIGDDKDDEDADILNLYFDCNNDDHWPPQPADDGVYYFEAGGTAYYVPIFDSGNGVEYGEWQENPPGVDVSFGMLTGARIIEVSFDMTSGPLQHVAGESLGMGLLYWDQYGNDWAFTAAWPPIMGSVGGTYAAFLGDAELGREADRIFTDPQQLEFSAQQGGEATAALELSVGATTENEQDFMATVSEPWILVSRNEATTPATIEVRAEPGSLAPGAYVGALTIIAPGAKNSPLQVPVGFEVEELPPRFGVEPGQVDFKMTEGGQLPAAQNITVSNLGGGDLEWKATVSGDWFQLSALEGSAPAKPSVTVNDEQLPTGSYSGVILFSAPGIDPAPVKVSLNVEARQVDAEDPDETAGCSCTSAGRLPLPGASLLLLLVLLAGIRRR